MIFIQAFLFHIWREHCFKLLVTQFYWRLRQYLHWCLICRWTIVPCSGEDNVCSLCKIYSLLSQGALLPWQQCFFNLSAVTQETYGTRCAAGSQHAGHAWNMYLTPELFPSAIACAFAATTLVTVADGCGMVGVWAPSPWMCDHAPWQFRRG